MQRVIDSLLVCDRAAVALNRHIERMTVAASHLGYSEAEVAAKYLEIPDDSAWFPLIEATPEYLRVVMRRAPELRNETRLVTVRDSRRFPTVKGADPEITAADRKYAIEHGADDAAYLVDGVLTECANGALLAWDPTGTSITVSASERVLQSTTLDEFLSHFSGPVHCSNIEPNIHPDAELWYVNALHGITPVTKLDGVAKNYDRARLNLWRNRYESWRRPL